VIKINIPSFNNNLQLSLKDCNFTNPRLGSIRIFAKLNISWNIIRRLFSFGLEYASDEYSKLCRFPLSLVVKKLNAVSDLFSPRIALLSIVLLEYFVLTEPGDLICKTVLDCRLQL